MVDWASEVKSIDWLTESDENHSNIGASTRCHFIDGSSMVETCTMIKTDEERDYVMFEITEHSLPTKCLNFYFDITPDGNGSKLTVGKEFELIDETTIDLFKMMLHEHMVEISGQIAAYISSLDGED